MLLLKCVVSVCSGDEGHHPVVPLRTPRPAPHLSPLLTPLPVHAVPGEDGGGGMGVGPGPARGRGGVPDLTQEVEEGTEGPDPGGDMTEHDPGPTTESE